MNCELIKIQLGRYLDEELSWNIQKAVEIHLRLCRACAAELDALRVIAAELAPNSSVQVPPELWDDIEQTMDQKEGKAGRNSGLLRFRQPIAMAASLLLVVGMGFALMVWTDGGVTKVEAAAVDFSVLLDELPLDPSKAFRRFLVMYQGNEVSPVEAIRHAPMLNFQLPDNLPGGFDLKTVYTLQFGDEPGVAAEYARNGEFLGTIFHPPVPREDFGSHKDYPCVVGQHHGHRVEVGPWKLVHITDPTTCHCVLSRLNEKTELPAVISAVVR